VLPPPGQGRPHRRVGARSVLDGRADYVAAATGLSAAPPKSTGCCWHPIWGNRHLLRRYVLSNFFQKVLSFQPPSSPIAGRAIGNALTWLRRGQASANTSGKSGPSAECSAGNHRRRRQPCCSSSRQRIRVLFCLARVSRRSVGYIVGRRRSDGRGGWPKDRVGRGGGALSRWSRSLPGGAIPGNHGADPGRCRRLGKDRIAPHRSPGPVDDVRSARAGPVYVHRAGRPDDSAKYRWALLWWVSGTEDNFNGRWWDGTENKKNTGGWVGPPSAQRASRFVPALNLWAADVPLDRGVAGQCRPFCAGDMLPRFPMKCRPTAAVTSGRIFSFCGRDFGSEPAQGLSEGRREPSILATSFWCCGRLLSLARPRGGRPAGGCPATDPPHTGMNHSYAADMGPRCRAGVRSDGFRLAGRFAMVGSNSRHGRS